ncbi:MAG: hypothetical protein K1X28_04485 [Parachlamydiales bacterium]|nr:hypothetical protein [Parachlamydiales bacterium]
MSFICFCCNTDSPKRTQKQLLTNREEPAAQKIETAQHTATRTKTVYHHVIVQPKPPTPPQQPSPEISKLTVESIVDGSYERDPKLYEQYQKYAYELREQQKKHTVTHFQIWPRKI